MEGERVGELGRPTLFSVPVSNPFPCIDCAIDRSLFFPSPRFYRRQTIFRTGEVSTVFLFFFPLSLSLSTPWKIVRNRGKRERENGDHSSVGEDFNKNSACLSSEMDR